MTSSAPPRSSTDAALRRTIDKAVAGWIEQGLVEESGWTGQPLMATRLPTGRGIKFDPERVEQVLGFFSLLRQLQGRWSGQPFRLLDWQVRWFIAPVFGIIRDGKRVLRTAWVEECRKNGKSTLCSGLGLYLAFADREAAAQVYAAAGSRDQASLVFDPARAMAAASPELAKRLGRGLQRRLLENSKTGSIFRPLVSDGRGRLHGLNVHGAVIDEVHVHKTPDTIDALETGTGSREQPLVIFITTADDGRDGSVYDVKRAYVEALVAGTIKDPTWLAVVFAAPPEMVEAAPFAPETLYAANPGIGWTVQQDYLEGKAREAQQSPAQLNRYLRLHLGKRTKQTVRWIPLDAWDNAAGLVDPATFVKRRAFGGLDLSAVSDFTAYVLIVQGVDEGWDVWPMFWLPDDRVDEIAKRTGMPLRDWWKAGWLRVTDGNVVDYTQMRDDITTEVKRLGVVLADTGYDPWNATETVVELQETAKFNVNAVRQGYATLSAPCKELERLVMGSTPEKPLFRHGGNPILRWMADCVEVASDPAGNIKPVKPPRDKSAKRIDGIAACVNALARSMAAPAAGKSKVMRTG